VSGRVLPIRILGDPVLREPSRDVEAFDDLLRVLSEDMLETMYQAPGVGLAAPQVGLSLRFFVYDDMRGSGPNAVANPVVSNLEGGETTDEGCLSIPSLYFPTARALAVRLDGVDVEGHPVSIEAEGFLARIFQHETDHLLGRLFIDRLGEAERREAMVAIREIQLAGDPRWGAGRPSPRSGRRAREER
jgi:peptide deformylase